MRITFAAAGFALTGTVLFASGPAVPDQQRAITMDEVGLRRQVVSGSLPEYPAGSLAGKRSGVAVASVIVGEDGRTMTIELLQAPDQETGAAVKKTLSQWTFIPAPQMTRQASLTFYFQITNGRGRVLNPQDMPGGPTIAPLPSARVAAPGAGPPPRPIGTPIVMMADISRNEIGADQFRELVKTSRPTVLDVRHRDEFARGHHEASVNIPFDELTVRGPIELDRSRPVVIDCSRTENYVCSFAAHRLESVKLPALYVFLP